ncbi:MarR family winged helix-turn-helix transcriptional regulator [Chromobacterium sp. IIBBL 290-4]|uniref:MarR family winged helix-turn-helix transcriptional regulator n=1 Tax=Chromobacterium sp. IIBBL 290-4 TaxID=2953890 RepID=UPI0020B7B884|nr:MarR family transcriptional regulator [Chromobacterium sp. IIBBL 290-4]UTH76235.1 MarR family transcriptional regulator [Chromobacterium sp. IIBBL 290-4]
MSNISLLPADATRLSQQLMNLARKLRKPAAEDVLPMGLLSVLTAIDRADGEATPSQLSRSEGMRSSNLASALRELEEEGLILRRPDLVDGRKTRLSVSEAGRAALQRNRLLRDGWLLEAMRELDEDELAVLLRAGPLMEKLAVAN